MIHVQIKSEQKFTICTNVHCHKPGSDVPKNIAVRDIRGFTVADPPARPAPGKTRIGGFFNIEIQIACFFLCRKVGISGGNLAYKNSRTKFAPPAPARHVLGLL